MSRRVALVGGHGGLSAAYRQAAAELGWSLDHHERRLPRDLGDALVLITVSTCGHQLAAEARTLARGKVVTLRSHSASAVRRALESEGA